jgi:hypothetical protein
VLRDAHHLSLGESRRKHLSDGIATNHRCVGHLVLASASTSARLKASTHV